MKLTTLGEIVFCATISVALLWEGRDYELKHKPMAQARWAYIEFLRCVEECENDQLAMCRKTKPNATLEECRELIDCSRCDKFKEEKD